MEGKTIKIVQFITHMKERGGAQVHVLNLALKLKSDGHEVIIIGSGNSNIITLLKNEGIRYIPIESLKGNIEPLNDLKTIVILYKLLKKINPDVLAIHSSKAGIIGRMVANFLNIPIVFTAHSWSFSGTNSIIKSKLYSGLERIVTNKRNGIIAISKHDYDLGIKYKIASRTNMKIIHNGIPDNNLIANPGVKNEIVKLTMIARFAEQKDHLFLIESLNEIRNENWELTFVGDGPLINNIKKTCYNLGLSNQINFIGEQENVVPTLLESNIFILISKYEGLPISIIEAMRCGLPIIASDVGAVNELVRNQKEGYLIDKGNKLLLNKVLTQLIMDPNLRKILGNNSRMRYKEKFEFQNMYNKTISFYKETSNYIERRS